MSWSRMSIVRGGGGARGDEVELWHLQLRFSRKLWSMSGGSLDPPTHGGSFSWRMSGMGGERGGGDGGGVGGGSDAGGGTRLAISVPSEPSAVGGASSTGVVWAGH
eukprot:6214569-Prymnesium_polylepis.1